MSNEDMFDVNSYVVYPSHGVGKIIEIETQNIAGSEIIVYNISFINDNMVLSIPVKRQKKVGLRNLITITEVEDVYNILSRKPQISKGMWSRRAQDYLGKINSGDIFASAEVVRDLFKKNFETSYSERMIYESAFERLVHEISIVKNVEYEQVNSEIEAIVQNKVLKINEEAA
ncbi:MAG: CarD family transcriptional regulator [Pseudomonadota bacterium]